MTQTRKLSIRLLKRSVKTPEAALKSEEDNNKLDWVPLTGDPEDKKLLAGQIYRGDPKWFKFFNAEEIATLKEKKILGAGGGGILFVRVNDVVTEGKEATFRWMAVCFGMGYHALSPDAIEPNFGTLVALNTIGQNLIRSIDTKRPEDATIQNRTQRSHKGDIFDFGVDTDRIILHSITGTPDDQGFATMVTGSEGLSINTKTDYNTIAEKCQEIYAAFLADTYEKRFPWYGKILPVKREELICTLDARLLEMLNGDLETCNVHLAPPDIVDYQDCEKFRYGGSHVQANRRNNDDDTFDELDIQEFVSRLENSDILSPGVLKETMVQVRIGDEGPFRPKWSVYKCLVSEVEDEETGAFYVLSNGEWYEINKDFVAKTRERYQQIEEVDLEFPPFVDDYHVATTKKGIQHLSEGKYNEHVVAVKMDEYMLCDTQTINFTGEKGSVEFCDLFSTHKHIVHVKMRDRSSCLSHLFMQGYVSAQAFKNEQEFRKKIREKMPRTAEEDRVPEAVPDCREYTVVFALIQKDKRYLPFFSQISLNATYQMISDMGYDVRILWIDRLDTIPSSSAVQAIEDELTSTAI